MLRPVAVTAALCVLVALCGCGGRHPVAAQGGEDAAQSTTQDYPAPPSVSSVEAQGGSVRLVGAAPADAKVRVASPDGEALFAGVEADGRWRLALGPLAQPRIYGLSAVVRGRAIQAEGYLLVAPDGRAAILRGGASAWRIDRPAPLGLRTVDFDRAGGAAISGAAAPRASVILRLDGRQIAQGRADEDGRYEANAPAPIPPGVHRLELLGDGFDDGVTVAVTPPEPLARGPLHSQVTAAGLRVDWMTPGGGVQSTILIH